MLREEMNQQKQRGKWLFISLNKPGRIRIKVRGQESKSSSALHPSKIFKCYTQIVPGVSPLLACCF
jgi:hypothetical protein